MEVAGKRALVMGLGRFGGGLSAARFLARRRARVIVTDAAPAESLARSLEQLEGVPLHGLHLGGHRASDFTDADIVVASPAVPPHHPLLALARAGGAVVTTEMNLFFQLCPATIIGVTGSNGKSTTAALIHHLMKQSGRRCWLGGNIGRGLLEHVDDIRPADFVVAELSSFQLEALDAIRRSPQVAVVTGLSPNHLDRHGTLAAYRHAKQTVLRYQSRGDVAILNADDADVGHWPARGRRFLYSLSDRAGDGLFLAGDAAVFRCGDRRRRWQLLDGWSLPGRHNLSNALGAVCCAAALGIDADCIEVGLGSFRPLPHRLELVAEVAGRRFYDDSDATTPEATAAALEALPGPLWLIAGGGDKGLAWEPLAARIAARVQGAALVGRTGAVLRRLIAQAAGPKADKSPLLRYCSNLSEAVRWCFRHSRPGHTILLSPAATSFGMFANYIERGLAFRQAVAELTDGRETNRAA